jgi:branched-chain amino acid transport system ATP-binding protein
MLKVEGLKAGYGAINILWDLSFEVHEGEIVAILGSNGAGKTTMVRAITGMVRPSAGSVNFNGEELAKKSSRYILDKGIVQVPEGRQIFTDMTVLENLEMGAFTRSSAEAAETLEKVYGLFPRLKERYRQVAGTLSGGEQQMLAMGRALMSRPKLMMLDEPSMGLAPILVQQIFDIIVDMNRQGTTILLVEQNAQMALSIANRAYVLETGRITMSGDAKELAASEEVKKAYLGG